MNSAAHRTMMNNQTWLPVTAFDVRPSVNRYWLRRSLMRDTRGLGVGRDMLPGHLRVNLGTSQYVFLSEP